MSILVDAEPVARMLLERRPIPRMCEGPSFSSVVYAQVPRSPLLSSERHSLHSSSPVEVD